MRRQATIAWAVLLAPALVHGDDWPTWRGAAGDGVWREAGVVERFEQPRLTPLWTAAISSGYSGPTVADGRVYVTDRLVEPKQTERVHCFDSKSGRQLWTHEYDCAYRGVGYEAGPRACVVIHDGRAYSLGTMGQFFCFDAANGRVIWQKDLGKEYDIEMPTWGIASTPVMHGDFIIVQIGGRPAGNLVAFDRVSGEERWRALEDGCSYSTPILIEQAGQAVLVCWTAERVGGLDPKTGKLHWAMPYEPGRVRMNVASPVYDGRHILVSSFFDGAQLIRVADDKLSAETVWRRRGADEKNTDAIHSTISTPLMQGEHIYGVDSYGELRCLKLGNGERVWEDLTATPKIRWGTIHFVRHEPGLALSISGTRAPEKTSVIDDLWLFNERGELIIGRVSPEGFKERSRAKIIDPTTDQLRRDDGVCWSHPAFADRCVFARNDKELVCVSLAK